MLITATEHYGAVVNRNFDYIAYLDDAAEKRQTLSRCFLLFRELQVFDPATQVKPINPHSPCKPLPVEYVAPWMRSGPGFATDGYHKFDLDRWNPEYFERLHGFLAAAQERDVIIELTLFSSAYSDAVWGLNPLNIQNNINGVGDIPWQDYISGRDGTLMERQMAYVSKVVEEVNGYDNFYFEVCNEPFTARAGMMPETEICHTIRGRRLAGGGAGADPCDRDGVAQEASYLPGAGRELAHRHCAGADPGGGVGGRGQLA